MTVQQRFQKAIQLFDELNSKDPNKEDFAGGIHAKELLYAQRMTERLQVFAPSASEALQLAARCQHICRWEIPRSTFPIGRKGYNQWRSTLRNFHAEKAATILKKAGYEEAMIDKVQFLVLKKQLKRNKETQILEDVICLVFLEFYFTNFAASHEEEKVIDILQKTWRKMSEEGQKAVLDLPLKQGSLDLIKKALGAA